MSSKKERKK